MLLEEADDQASANAANLAKNPLVSAILDACETLKKLQAAAAEGGPAAGNGRANKNSNSSSNAKQAFSGEALASAKGLIFMRTDKIGFGVSVTQGYGLLIARRPTPASPPPGDAASAAADAASSSSARWSAPLPLKIEGCSLGAVVGYSEQRTLLALATDAEVLEFCGGGNGAGGGNGNGGSNGNKCGGGGGGTGRRVKVGLDFGVGLGKRLNQSASVDAKAKGASSRGGGLAAAGEEDAAEAGAKEAPPPPPPPAAAATRAFTLSKGFIVDVSLRGLSVEPDADDLARAYGDGVTAADVLFGGGGGGGADGGFGGGFGGGGGGGGGVIVRPPPEAALLYRALAAAEGKA